MPSRTLRLAQRDAPPSPQNPVAVLSRPVTADRVPHPSRTMRWVGRKPSTHQAFALMQSSRSDALSPSHLPCVRSPFAPFVFAFPLRSSLSLSSCTNLQVQLPPPTA